MAIEIKSGKKTRFYLIILIHPKALYIVQETIYIGFKAKYKLYLMRLGPGYSLKLNFLFSAIRIFLIIDVAMAVTPTIVALSLIALSLVIRTVGFTFI